MTVHVLVLDGNPLDGFDGPYMIGLFSSHGEAVDAREVAITTRSRLDSRGEYGMRPQDYTIQMVELDQTAWWHL